MISRGYFCAPQKLNYFYSRFLPVKRSSSQMESIQRFIATAPKKLCRSNLPPPEAKSPQVFMTYTAPDRVLNTWPEGAQPRQMPIR